MSYSSLISIRYKDLGQIELVFSGGPTSLGAYHG